MKALKVSHAIAKAALVVFTLPQILFAGTNSGGGGDTRAEAFVNNYGKGIQFWLTNNPNAIDVDSLEVASLLVTLKKSLDTKDPLVRFQNVAQINCFGASKEACTNTDGSIDVAAISWSASSKSEEGRCTLTAMELFVPFVKQNRYEKAKLVCASIYNSRSKEKTTQSTTLNRSSENPLSMENSLKNYVRNYPLYGIQEMNIDSGWFKISEDRWYSIKSPSESAKNAAREELLRKVKDEGKKIIESDLSFELADSCDRNEDYVKELWTESSSRTSISSAAVATPTMAAAYTVASFSSYSSYYALKDVYCKTPSKYVRAIINASTNLVSKMDEKSLDFYVHKHIARSLARSADKMETFLQELTALKTNPYVDSNRYGTFGIKSGEGLQNWAVYNIGQLKTAIMYIQFIRTLNIGRDSESTIVSFMVKANAIVNILANSGEDGLQAAIFVSNKSVQVLDLVPRAVVEDLLNLLGQTSVNRTLKSNITPEGKSRLQLQGKCIDAYTSLKNVIEAPGIINKINEMIKTADPAAVNLGSFLKNQCKDFYKNSTLNIELTYYTAAIRREYSDEDFQERGCYPYVARWAPYELDLFMICK